MHAAVRLPVELLDVIVSYACTDGGRAACALRLTSKTMRDIVDPHKFHTVAIPDAFRMKPFLETWEDSTEKSKANLRHVFLSTSGVCTGLPRLLGDFLIAISPVASTLTLITSNNESKHPSLDIFADGEVFAQSLTFPRLTHFTLAVPDILRRTHLRYPPSPPIPRFPALTHAHFAMSTCGHL
ncbi:hypothetical protein OE88DRAFT_1659324 [Heliocybe sulcata]|uniref:Uncharacterized protein n=1 Tax=Heliocybe sulcata TaxID=5364 RepID=A0A5C3N2E3_9AGAM|nr:hypothetical protein OE88DRAFT_1659324 [Heliocybe sulcata]